MTYIPQFNRYPPGIVDRLMRIAAARAVIESAHILPAQEDELRRKARVGTIHYSTLIEGNELSLIEAERAVGKKLEPLTTAKRELVNYVRALEFLDERHSDGEIAYNEGFLLDLHAIATRGLGVAGEQFAPEHEGIWRPGTAVVGDDLGNVFHAAPSPDEVPRRIADLCEYLELKRAQANDYPAPILAGVAHYALTDIHPFADGNGRVARLFAVAVLFREGLVTRRLFSAERYYASDKDRYYDALRSVRRNTNNLEAWLLYFTTGLAEEFERVADRVRELNGFTERVERAIQLNRYQEVALAAFTAGDRKELSRSEYEALTGRGASAAKSDLSELVAARVLRVVGRGRATAYRLATPISRGAGPRGRAAVWTEERIRSELGAFLAGRTTWPEFAVFEHGGQVALYKAASRHGGIRRWAAEFDLWH